MRKLQVRDVPEDVYSALQDEATRNERSLEAQLRFMVKEWAGGGEISRFPYWMQKALETSAKDGFRSVHHELLKRLTESFRADGIEPPADPDKERWE